MSHHETIPGHFHHMEPEAAYHGAKLGMWLFLVTEVLLFGGLFTAFAIYRYQMHDDFVHYQHMLNWKLGALNTLVLLTSSYFMVRGVDRAQHGDNEGTIKWLDLTFLCGLIFMVVKGFEYYAKFEHGLLPSKHIFMGLYFMMTGIHGLHVLIGMGLMVWLRKLAKKGEFSTHYYTPVEVCGLYWHLVDIVWIYLFPVVYLLGGLSLSGGGH